MKRKPRAFTLTEVVVVVVLIAFLALAIYIMVGSGGQEAMLQDSLGALRGALLQYANDHNGSYPTGTGDEVAAKLTKWTNAAGEVGSKVVGYPHGPYLLDGIPTLLVGDNKGAATILVVTGIPVPDEASGAGWVYSTDTHTIIANTTAKDQNSKPYAEY
jgi:prepilin-type N-terminal cleavage/methylation domain-containing protein